MSLYRPGRGVLLRGGGLGPAAWVELYTRQPDHRWVLSEATGLDAILRLSAVDCEPALRCIFDKIPQESGI